MTVGTNGKLTATIVDPADGAVVGGYSGVRTLSYVTFTVDPRSTAGSPLLVGTASFDPRLGHAVPAGVWALVAPLGLIDGCHRHTPALTFRVTG